MPIVSIVIPVYNSEKFLEQCLDSLICQSFSDMEIICINDGSTDHSLQILNAYAAKDERIRVFTKENEGKGAASARNMGMDHAVGKYIQFLDSDDFFEPDMLEKAFHQAETTDADIVVFGGYEYDHPTGCNILVTYILDSSVIPDKKVFSYVDILEKIFQLSAGMAWNKLYRRDFLLKHNVRFQKIKYTDDAYFTFANMVLAERITVVDKALCHYRVNSGSNQTGGLDNYPDSAFMPYIKLKEFFSSRGIYETIKQSFVNYAVVFMRSFYDRVTRYETFQYLHNKLRNEVLHELDAAKQPKEFFYDSKRFDWCQMILSYTSGEVAFRTARAYDAEYMTGVLRFPFPSGIPRGSKVVIAGAKMIGRLYYVQAVLGRCCDVVLWVDDDNEFHESAIKPYAAMRDIDFDYVLIATVRSAHIEKIMRILGEMKVPSSKIIMGRNC